MTLSVIRSQPGREPYAVLRIFFQRCTRTFGVSPCTGSGEPCFKTLASCKSRAAYNAADAEYVFVTARTAVPTELAGAVPILEDIDITPAKIDPGGSIGSRSVMEATLRDIPHNDVGFDPHVTLRTYDVMERGTLLGRFKARNPYYANRVVVAEIGYLEDGSYKPENFRRCTFFIEAIDGPSRDGMFRITAKDLLKQLDDKRAVCPRPNVGRVSVAFGPEATTFTLTPTGIGNAEYPASGRCLIGEEKIRFTRVGDVMTMVERGLHGSEVKQHAENEVVQVAKRFVSMKVHDIVYELETSFASVPTKYIPKAEWNQEQVDYLPRLYSADVYTPTPVKQLVNELLQCTGVSHWWDEEAAALRFKSIRPLADDVVHSLGEHEHLLRETLDIKDMPAARLTQAHVYYDIIDPSKDIDEPTNYRQRHIEGDLAAEGPEMYGDKRIKQVFCRWITGANAVAAIDLGQKTLARFRRVPRTASFVLDEKDGYLRQGDFVQLSSQQAQQLDGASEPVNIQLLSRKFLKLATHTQYMGTEFFYLAPQTGPTGKVERLVVIAAPVNNLNLRSLHNSIYADLSSDDVVRFRFLNGAYVTSANKANPAIDVGTWPSGVRLFLELHSGCRIVGAGGAGVSYSAYNVQSTTAAQKRGGVAIYTRRTITVNVQLGALLHGGPGGGCGLHVISSAHDSTLRWSLGGGGGHSTVEGGAFGAGGRSVSFSGTVALPNTGADAFREPALDGEALSGGTSFRAGWMVRGAGAESKSLTSSLAGLQAGFGGDLRRFNGAGRPPSYSSGPSIFGPFTTSMLPSSGTHDIVIGGLTTRVRVDAGGEQGAAIDGASFATVVGDLETLITGGDHGPLVN
jgi:hypothetical protein